LTMAFTYAGDPSVSNLAKVRFLCMDTDSTDQLLADAEIEYVLSVQTNVTLAAARCCENIAAKFARKPSFSNGALSMGAERVKQYTDLAATLRRQASAEGNTTATIKVGGRKISERDDLANDTTVVQPSFAQGLDDNPHVPNTTPNQKNLRGDW
jgi:hypothetical protein